MRREEEIAMGKDNAGWDGLREMQKMTVLRRKRDPEGSSAEGSKRDGMRANKLCNKRGETK